MRLSFMRSFALAAALGSAAFLTLAPARAQANSGQSAAAARPAVTVQAAWARAMAPAAKVGAGYFELRNNGKAPVRLVAVRSTIAGKVEMHSMSMEGNIMKMRPLADGVEIAAGQSVSFKPGSYHLMFINPKKPFTAGENFTVQFKFADGAVMEVPFTVREAAASQHETAHH